MEVSYLYQKKRKEFGKHVKLEEVESRVVDSTAGTSDMQENFIARQPSVKEFDCSPLLSEHSANTERKTTQTLGMLHKEGGWPKDVDKDEQSDVLRFRKKVEKTADYSDTVKELGPVVDRCVKQNNTIDIYQDYFGDGVIDHSSEPPSAKGLAKFRDPNKYTRSATSICWSPEGRSRVAVCYSVLSFQDPTFMKGELATESYVWDVSNPNTPEIVLTPSSPLMCSRFNPKTPELFVGGCYNGLIQFWDLRKNNAGMPTESSVIEKSHHDPVYDIFWISSKTGNQCVSVSTDGQLLWWDTRRLGEPTDKLMLEGAAKQPNAAGTYGGSSLEYNTEAGPTKYLVGTEQGVVLSVNLRNRKSGNSGIQVFDTGAGKHHGPIYSIQRNPTHSKYFLTIGDWTARVWTEELKTPIMTTKYHQAYVTGGCWSPTRAGVFFVTRMDGVLDVWDYFFRQNDPAYTHKVGDHALCSISATQASKNLVAIGDVEGTVTLLELCDSLVTSQPSEKMGIAGMFDRETKREKNLEQRAKELARKGNNSSDDKDKTDGKNSKMDSALKEVEDDFLSMIKEMEKEEETNNQADASKDGSMPMGDDANM